MTLRWHEEPISRQHDRNSFDCGDEALNHFLRHGARQAHEKGGAKTFVAVESGTSRIVGFYTLCPASIAFERSPAIVRKGLARHEVPAFRLARLAVDRSAQGQGLGGKLLFCAARRCVRVAQEVGGVALVIDAKNERASAWYQTFGAVQLLDSPQTLVLPFRTFLELLKDP